MEGKLKFVTLAAKVSKSWKNNFKSLFKIKEDGHI